MDCRITSGNDVLTLFPGHVAKWSGAEALHRVRGNACRAIFMCNAPASQTRPPPFCGVMRSIPLHAAGIGPINEAAVAARESGNLGHLRRAQREVEDRGVF